MSAAGALGGAGGDRRGSVAIEFALAMPVLILILLGCIDVGRLVLAHQKAERTAATVADLVARASPFQNTPSQVCAAMDAAAHVFEPFVLTATDTVRVTSVTLTGTSVSTPPTAMANWRAELTGGGTPSCTTTTLGTPTTVPGGLALGLENGDEVYLILGEMVYTHDAWFYAVLDSDPHHPMTLQSVVRPRQSSLAALLPDPA